MNSESIVTNAETDEFLDIFSTDENIDYEKPVVTRRDIMHNRAVRAGIINADEELPSYIIEKQNEKTGETSYSVHTSILADFIRKRCTFVSVQDKFSKSNRIFWYEGGVYKQINDDTLQGYIKRYITDIDISLLRMRDVWEVAKDLRTDLKFVREDIFNSDENIINFRNGVFSLSDGRLYPHSPEFYSTVQIPCDYSPKKTSCPNFCKYLNDLTQNDKDKQRFLMQYMGVAISNIQADRMKKMLFLCGEGNSGKSKILELTQRLLGDDNIAVCNLKDLEEKFGTSALYHKRLAGHGDMSALSVDEISTIKTLTGGDSVRGEFKGGNIFNFRFHGLLWFCTNQLPRFGGDKGEHVYERFIIMNIRHSIPESKRDTTLADKMYAERTAIINLLIPEIRRVVANGYKFDIPSDCVQDIEEYKIENSPVRQFYDECCVMRNNLYIDAADRSTKGNVFKAFQEWYKDNVGNRYQVSAQTFRKETMQHLGYSSVEEMEVHKRFGNFYTFELTEQARKEYL